MGERREEGERENKKRSSYNIVHACTCMGQRWMYTYMHLQCTCVFVTVTTHDILNVKKKPKKNKN